MKKSYAKQLEEQNEELQQKLAYTQDQLRGKELRKDLTDWLYCSFVSGIVHEMATNVGHGNKVNVKKMKKLCETRLSEFFSSLRGNMYSSEKTRPSYWRKYMDIIEPVIEERMKFDKHVDEMMAQMNEAIERKTP